ncbi:MAG: hypothetical protein BWY77_01216 [bacterium ADurb.Bin431]|nr:MAG: hypothetical protein BWY77_01216 [bacterium ADurb.Bin431]
MVGGAVALGRKGRMEIMGGGEGDDQRVQSGGGAGATKGYGAGCGIQAPDHVHINHQLGAAEVDEGMVDKMFGAEQSHLLGGEGNEEQGAFGLFCGGGPFFREFEEAGHA